MKGKNTRSLFAAVKLLVALSLFLMPTMAYADDGPPDSDTWANSSTEVRPELGPDVASLPAGTNGYKVFGPGAIQRVPVEVEMSLLGLSGIDSINLYRSGYTDAWRSLCQGIPCQYSHNGSHTSDSDLQEQEIWADGYLKNIALMGWRTSCSNRTSGSSAFCPTSFTEYCRNIYAETNHHHHTSGYVDSNFTTGDTQSDWLCSD